MSPTNDLDRLAAKYGSDKFGGHRYTPHYHRFFSSLREHPVELLEIGIGGYANPASGGASLRMWRDYFPNGTIRGLDYEDKAAVAGDRIRVYRGSQADPLAIARILADTPGGMFDIVIDDGSHRSEHVIASFLMLYQYIKPGGWYVVEDTQTAYWSEYGGNSADLNAPMSTMAFFRQFIDGINWREIHRPGYRPTYFDENIVSIHFYHNLIFVEKGANDEPSNHLRAGRVPSMT